MADLDFQQEVRTVLENYDGRDNPSCWFSRVTVTALTRQRKKFLESVIVRLITTISIFLSLAGGKGWSTEDTIARFNLNDQTVLAGLVALGRHNLLFKTVKTWCAWPMARALGEKLPSSPLVGGASYEYLFGAQVRRFLRARIGQGDINQVVPRKVVKLADSLLKVKDAMLDVDDSFVARAFVKYRKQLSASPLSEEEIFQKWRGGREKERGKVEGGKEEKGDDVSSVNWRPIYERKVQSIRTALEATVNEVFKPIDTRRYLDDQVMPSMSASYETKRDVGGAAHELIEEAKSKRRQYDQNGLPLLRGSGEILYRMLWTPTGGLERVLVNPVYLSGTFINEGRARARVCPVLEPCKVRWISIGDAKPYFRAKAWNRIVLSQMREHPTFRLVGEPLTESAVNLMEHQFLLSGDYSAATDTLDPQWSLLTLELITQRIYKYARTGGPGRWDWSERTMGLRHMLTKHRLSYKTKENTQCFDQETGQLMGSYLSFPILCVLNAAVNRAFLDPLHDEKIANLPLLVNGDDVMMSSPKPFTHWTSHVGLVGLTPSVGKNYVHTSVCCLNSEFYTRGHGKKFTRIHPYRLSLIFGQSRQSGKSLWGSTTATPFAGSGPPQWLTSLGSKARRLVAEQTEKDRGFLLGLLIKHNLRTLKDTSRSWWVPEQLGGLGLPLCRQSAKKISETGRKVATYLLTKPDPEDVLMYAPRGCVDTNQACKRWMSACKKIHIYRGDVYRWRTEDESLVDFIPPPVPLRQFLGYGVTPTSGLNRDQYRRVVGLALRMGKNVKLVSDETLIRFSKAPRQAGWLRPALTPTTP